MFSNVENVQIRKATPAQFVTDESGNNVRLTSHTSIMRMLDMVIDTT